MSVLDILFSLYWFEFITSGNYCDLYSLSSSKNVYFETMLKFSYFPWDGRGISHNPNVYYTDVIDHPEFPWIYTEFKQEWVDEQWVNSFPFYSEEIVLHKDFVPDFIRNKIRNGYAVSYANEQMIQNYPELILKDIYIKPKENNCFNETKYGDLENSVAFGEESFHICGVSYLTFIEIEKYRDEITIKIDPDTFFKTEYERFIEFMSM